MYKRITPILIILMFLFSYTHQVQAQEQIDTPVYIVQSGDNLTSIAVKFGVSLNSLIEANHISDPNALRVGDRIVIPGLEGVRGILVTRIVPLGENITSISRKYQLPMELLTRLNRITSPSEVYAGVELIVPEPEEASPRLPLISIKEGQSLLEAAVLTGRNPWYISEANQLEGFWDSPTGEILYMTAREGEVISSAVSPLITELSITPLPLVQGKTTTITVKSDQPLSLTGVLADQDLHFFEVEPGHHVAFAGIHALHETGLTEIILQANTPAGDTNVIQQMIYLAPGAFINESIVGVQPITIDPEVIERENQILSELVTITPNRKWSGIFQWPVDEPCPASRFGNRRSFNQGQFFYYHTGLDFRVCAQNLNIYASAPGTVIFAGPLEIKGGFTVIDHGWGIYSGYAHQSEFFVKPGDWVEAGQLIGIIGNTGRSIGPHLHWEIWVNGVPVDPLDWVDRVFP